MLSSLGSRLIVCCFLFFCFSVFLFKYFSLLRSVYTLPALCFDFLLSVLRSVFSLALP
jgi:hypothetical protein